MVVHNIKKCKYSIYHPEHTVLLHQEWHCCDGSTFQEISHRTITELWTRWHPWMHQQWLTAILKLKRTSCHPSPLLLSLRSKTRIQPVLPPFIHPEGQWFNPLARQDKSEQCWGADQTVVVKNVCNHVSILAWTAHNTFEITVPKKANHYQITIT